VVERRQVSAPAAEGGASRLIRGARRARWHGHLECVCRRSASLFLLSFFPSSLPGIDPAIHTAKRQKQNSRWLAWHNVSMDRRIKSGGDGEVCPPPCKRGRGTMRVQRAWWRGRVTRRSAFVAEEARRLAPLPPRKSAVPPPRYRGAGSIRRCLTTESENSRAPRRRSDCGAVRRKNFGSAPRKTDHHRT
jgi:hypothetical protein